MMLFFVGKMFGGLVENEPYYVTSIIDEQTFTISSIQNPITTKVYGVLDSTDYYFPNTVVVANDVEFNVNDPVIFDPFTVTDAYGSVTTYNSFGGINAGQLYYVSEQDGAGHIKLSNAPNSSPITLTAFYPTPNSYTYGVAVNQKTCINVYTAKGSINTDINLPVSPGQITGQEFTLYQTSPYFVNNEESGYTNLFSELVDYVIGTPYSTAINRVMLDETQVANIYQVYNNMPVVLDQNIGGLTSGTTYYIIGSGNATVNVLSTSSTGNILTADDTSTLYVGMPIIFSGNSIGNVLIGVTYYVYSIVSETTFKITTQKVGGSAYVLTNDNGTMLGTGSVYLQLSDSLGGSTVSLTSASPSTTTNLTQSPVHDENIAVRYIIGGYDSYIISGGQGYAVDNQFVITGDQLGGVSPANDLTMIVNTIDSNGAITSLIRNGTPAGVAKQYWLKAIDENQLAVYSNPIMTVPVSGLDFQYNGVTQTNVIDSDLTGDTLTLADITNFNVNDPVIFTGTVAGGLTAGVNYYITNVTSDPSMAYPNRGTIQVSATLTGSTFNILANNVTCTIAKIGDFILLPESFYFNQSIVKFNNKVWRCLVSNNDTDFIFGKWELLQSGDNVLNALDRTIGYYEPTIDMPGVDLTQLFEGVTYPNSTYKANAFAPDEEFPIDVIINDLPFYPEQINIESVVWNGTTYIAPSNSPHNSLNLIQGLANDWTIDNLTTNKVIHVNNIMYNPDAGLYIITTTNSVTPILLSNDGTNFKFETGLGWITTGAYTPFDSTPYDITNFDVSGVEVPSTALYAANYAPVNQSYYYNTNTTFLYVAVGENVVNSTDAYTWQEVYAAPQNNTLLLRDVQHFNTSYYVGWMAVGKITNVITKVTTEIILKSLDGYAWTNALPSPLGNNSLNSVATNIDVLIAVGDNGVIYSSINSANWSLVASGTTSNLNKVIFANATFVAVGSSGKILTSHDAGVTWVTQISGTTENLNSITFNIDKQQWVIVGDNNTILESSDTVTWVPLLSKIVQETATYNIQDDSFESGYSPEELVSGVVRDNLTMVVNTRPGTNWDPNVYQHVGYEVVSKEFTPVSGTQVEYSFKNMVSVPAQIKV